MLRNPAKRVRSALQRGALKVLGGSTNIHQSFYAFATPLTELQKRPRNVNDESEVHGREATSPRSDPAERRPEEAATP